MSEATIPATQTRIRMPALDIARGVALIAMAIFHFAWDLEFFDVAPRAMTLEPQWVYFARSIASSFLILVGISAWLAHNNGVSVPTLTKRILMVGGSALVISLVTYQMMPDQFIFFGILHNITASSILILLFLRLHALIVAIAALFFFTGDFWIRLELFESPVFWWLGLLERKPPAVDYVPLFPWFGWVLTGLLVARILEATGSWTKLSQISGSDMISRLLAFFGRHSLVFYLLHQPVLIATIYVTLKLIGYQSG